MGELPSRLSYEDAAFLNFDRDQFPYNVGSVAIFEGPISFDAYLAHVGRRLDCVPRYRQRALRVPLDLAHPAWHDDPGFDIQRHVSLLELPSPGDDEQLRRVAAEFFATPLDRDRPLWEIRLVRGLSGQRSAQLAKAHHCLVDGVAGVQLLGALLDLEPDPPQAGDSPAWAPGQLPGAAERLIDAVFDLVAEQIVAGERLALTLLDPRLSWEWTRSVAGSLRAALPHLFRIGRGPWNARLTAPTRLAWQVLPFSGVHRTAKALQGTINDVVLTILSGALGRYLVLHRYDTPEAPVRVAVPVNVRTEEEGRALGNRVAFMLAGLPVAQPDPIERFRAIHEEVANLKLIDQAGGLDRLMSVLGQTAPAFQRLLGTTLRLPNFASDLVCTNVPGPRVPLYCMGHRMIDHYPWVPIGWRMGLGVAVMSYDQGLYFALTADRSVLPDLDRLAGLLGESFDELLRAAGAGEEAPVTAPPEFLHAVPVTAES